MVNKIDLETNLYAAAAEAQKVVEEIKEKGLPAMQLRYALERKIIDQVELARDGSIPIEDAILNLNEAAGKETAMPEPIFSYPYGPPPHPECQGAETFPGI